MRTLILLLLPVFAVISGCDCGGGNHYHYYQEDSNSDFFQMLGAKETDPTSSPGITPWEEEEPGAKETDPTSSPGTNPGEELVDSKCCVRCQGIPGERGIQGIPGVPGQDGTLPIWELCLSLAGTLILLYWTKLAVDTYFKKWQVRKNKTTSIQFNK